MSQCQTVANEENTADLGAYYEDPVDFLRAVMNALDIDLEMRMQAAKILAGVQKAPRKVVTEYKGRDAQRLEAVDSDSVFANAGLPQPMRMMRNED